MTLVDPKALDHIRGASSHAILSTLYSDAGFTFRTAYYMGRGLTRMVEDAWARVRGDRKVSP